MQIKTPLLLLFQPKLLPLLSSILCALPGGTVGMICTSLFATTSVNSYAIDGAFYGNGLHLGKTLAVLVVLVPWVAIFTWGCLFVTDKIMSLRVSGGLGCHVALYSSVSI
jgi:hypothetical protein